eukprot:1791213-Pleurochrysis_carterae.AAC.3
MATSRLGRLPPLPADDELVPAYRVVSVHNSALRAFAPARFPSLAVGSGARRLPGSGSSSCASGASGSAFQDEAKGAGAARAAAIAARTSPARPAPSVRTFLP